MPFNPVTLNDDYEGEQLTVRYVPLSQIRKWNRNPKQHDLDEIIYSIEEHGFKDPPKYEPSLNDGEGGLVEGNGRDSALDRMYEADFPPPRGIMVNKESGEWAIPILFGVDAPSQAAAESYAVDHNNLTLNGFSSAEVARMYDPASYAALLRELENDDHMPVSVMGDDIDGLLEELAQQAAGGADGEGDYDTVPSDGSLLSLVDVTIDEPRNQVQSGDVWSLGDNILICADVLTDWPLWKPYLKDNAVFSPYAGPFVPLSIKYEQDGRYLVMVQPHPYIAGHILDRYEEVNGEGSIRKHD